LTMHTSTTTANRLKPKRRRSYDTIRTRSNGHHVYGLNRNTLQRRRMRCPKCHTKTEVLHTYASDLRVRRRRECPACKRRMTSHELTDEAWVEYLTEALKKVLKVRTDD